MPRRKRRMCYIRVSNVCVSLCIGYFFYLSGMIMSLHVAFEPTYIHMYIISKVDTWYEQIRNI